jgi:hypothetical protein
MLNNSLICHLDPRKGCSTTTFSIVFVLGWLPKQDYDSFTLVDDERNNKYYSKKKQTNHNYA